jgi:hypothetical protein
MENPSNHKLLLSSSYFPPLEYFVNLLRYEKVFIDIHETYPKQTWRNRCRILSANGLMDLTIPVEKPHGNHTKTSEIIISSHSSWQKNHWRSIESAYRNAPFYIFYKDLIEEFIMDRGLTSLYILNHQILKSILEELDVSKPVEFTDSFIDNSEGYTDLRFSISPKAKDRRTGKEMIFESYYQVFSDKFGFQPNLSILDLLFNSGPDTLKYLQNSASE